MGTATRFDRHPFKTSLVVAGIIGAALLLMTEVILRVIGLGDPVLYETHPDYGYRPRPNQQVRRFGGAVVRINNLGLRALDDWHTSAKKVLFVGDSVTYGGSWVSTEDLFAVRAVPAGWSGGSAGVNAWGIGNMHGLIVRHQFLPAGVYVTVLIDNDFDRGFSERRSFFRTTKPLFAIAEFTPHVTERLAAYARRPSRAEAATARQKKRGTVERSVRQLVELDALLRQRGFVHLIYLSPARAHLERRAAPDAMVASALAQTPLRVVRLQDHPELARLSPAEIPPLYQDAVHLSGRGHEVWAAIINSDLKAAAGFR
jgi:hypothetical protein